MIYCDQQTTNRALMVLHCWTLAADASVEPMLSWNMSFKKLFSGKVGPESNILHNQSNGLGVSQRSLFKLCRVAICSNSQV